MHAAQYGALRRRTYAANTLPGAPMNATPEPSATPRNSGRRWFAGLVALGGLGLVAAQVPAQGWRRRGALDPQERARRLDYRIGRLVQDVGGTAEQKQQIVAIATAAIADLQPLREQARQARLRSLQLLAAPVIDRAALEQQRALQVQAVDARSRRTLQAMADAAEVLTPDQRAKVAARMQARIARRFGG
jgi:periplasmic protein CpxP/Spy